MQAANDSSVGIVRQALNNITDSILARLPYIAIGVILFGAFWLIGRLVKRVIRAAGSRTKIDSGENKLLILKRLAGMFIISLYN